MADRCWWSGRIAGTQSTTAGFEGIAADELIGTIGSTPAEATCRSVLGHDHNAKRLDATATPSEIGSIFGGHRHSRCLLIQVLNQDFRPSTAQHIEYIALITTPPCEISTSAI